MLVDTALGIIVRSEQIFAGQTLEVAELTDLVIDRRRSTIPRWPLIRACSGRHQACRASPGQTTRTNRSAAEPLGGLLGPDALWQALGERDFGSTHWIARLRLAMPGRYRLDFLTGRCRPYRAIACDGTQSTTGYNDKVVTGPVTQPEPDIRAIVDPELGIALRQTSYHGSRPATRSELRSVVPDPETTQAGTSDPAEFRIAPEPGMRTVTGWLEERQADRGKHAAPN